MLGLMIVGLAAEPGHATPKPLTGRSPVSERDGEENASCQGEAEAANQAAAAGVEQHAVVKMFTLKTGTTDAVLKKKIRASYAGLLHDHRRAAFVLTFGTSNPARRRGHPRSTHQCGSGPQRPRNLRGVGTPGLLAEPEQRRTDATDGARRGLPVYSRHQMRSESRA